MLQFCTFTAVLHSDRIVLFLFVCLFVKGFTAAAQFLENLTRQKAAAATRTWTENHRGQKEEMRRGRSINSVWNGRLQRDEKLSSFTAAWINTENPGSGQIEYWLKFKHPLRSMEILKYFLNRFYGVASLCADTRVPWIDASFCTFLKTKVLLLSHN